jgi:hypothetical protein
MSVFENILTAIKENEWKDKIQLTEYLLNVLGKIKKLDEGDRKEISDDGQRQCYIPRDPDCCGIGNASTKFHYRDHRDQKHVDRLTEHDAFSFFLLSTANALPRGCKRLLGYHVYRLVGKIGRKICRRHIHESDAGVFRSPGDMRGQVGIRCG